MSDLRLQEFNQEIKPKKTDHDYKFAPGDKVWFVNHSSPLSGIVSEQFFSSLDKFHPEFYDDKPVEWYRVIHEDLPHIGYPGAVFKTKIEAQKLIDELEASGAYDE